jgi:hypothetical protein
VNLHIFPTSDEDRETPILLDPLERATLGNPCRIITATQTPDANLSRRVITAKFAAQKLWWSMNRVKLWHKWSWKCMPQFYPNIPSHRFMEHAYMTTVGFPNTCHWNLPEPVELKSWALAPMHTFLADWKLHDGMIGHFEHLGKNCNKLRSFMNNSLIRHINSLLARPHGEGQ